MKKLIKEAYIKNKRVIIRCDLNVPIKDGRILDDTRIIKSLPTIEYLLDNEAAIIIMSHLGKVESIQDFKTNSLSIVAKRLEELLKVKILFCDVTHGDKLTRMTNNLQPKEVLLMENTRFEDVPDRKESKCDEELSKYWASLGDIFVNDAFGSSHRAHASVCGIAKYLPSYNGLLLESEVSLLDKVLNNPKKPLTVIMGGAKVDDKIDLIKALIDKCDNLIVGGGIANTFLLARGIQVGQSLVSQSMLKEVENLLDKYSDKIILPVDVIVGKLNSDYHMTRNLSDIEDDELIGDIGDKSIEKFTWVINDSQTIFINGTVGMYENKLFDSGTKEILKACYEAKILVITAGGDAMSATNKYGYQDDFLISTGGGSSLEYLAHGDLPGIIK